MTAPLEFHPETSAVTCLLRLPERPALVAEPLFSAVSESDLVGVSDETDSSLGMLGPIEHKLRLVLHADRMEMRLSTAASGIPQETASEATGTTAADEHLANDEDDADREDAGFDDDPTYEYAPNLPDLFRAALNATEHSEVASLLSDARDAGVTVLAEMVVAEFPFAWMPAPGSGSVAWEFDPRDWFPHLDQGAFVDQLWDQEELPESILRGSLYLVAGVWVHPYADRLSTGRVLLGSALRWLSRGRRDLFIVSPGMEPNNAAARSPLLLSPLEWERIAPGWGLRSGFMSDAATMHHFGAGIGAHDTPPAVLIQIAQDMDSHHSGGAQHFWRLLGRSRSLEWAPRPLPMR